MFLGLASPQLSLFLSKLSELDIDFINENSEYNFNTLVDKEDYDNYNPPVCNYLELDELNLKLSCNNNKNSLSIYSHNIRSLVPKFNSILEMHSNLNCEFSVLAF